MQDKLEKQVNEGIWKRVLRQCAYINFDDNIRMNKLFDEDFDLERIIQGLKIEQV